MLTDESEKTRRIQRRVIWNTLTNFAGKVVTLGSWFFLTPFVLHTLGNSAYGLWVLVGSLTAYGALFDFGIAGSVIKYVAEYHTRREYDRAHKLVATALWLYTFSGLLVILIGAAVSPLVPKLIHVPAGEESLASSVVVLTALGVGIYLPCSASIAVLRGLQRFDLVNLISIVGMTLYALSIVAVLLLGGGLLGLVAVNIPVNLVMQIPSIWLIYRIFPELRFGWKGAERKYIRTVAFFSSAVVVNDIAGLLQQKTDEIVIGVFLPVSSITPYSIAHRLGDLPLILTDQFMKVIMPLASQLHTENDHGRLRLLYLISTRLTLAIFIVLGTGIVILSRPFIAAWIGPQYAFVGPLVILLVSASLVSTVMFPANSVLQGMAKHRLLAIFAIGSGILNLVLSILLVRPYGITGVAYGTLIPNLIECIFFVMPYTFRVLGISLGTAVRKIFLPALVPALPLAAVLYGLRETLHPTSLFMLAFIGVISALVYAGVYLWMGENAQERQVVFGLFRAAMSHKESFADLIR